MAVRDLIPWNRGREVSPYRGEETSPFLSLHREMNRLFDDTFRDIGLAPLNTNRFFDRDSAWPTTAFPQVEISETDKEMKVTAELPGLEEKDVNLELSNGVLVISGEKKTETEDKERRFSERSYGRFERRIPVEDIEEDKVAASFKNGILTVTMPKSAKAQQKAKRIAINGK